MRKVLIGSATNLGTVGADYYIADYGVLPNYYITKEEDENLGWFLKWSLVKAVVNCCQSSKIVRSYPRN